MSWDYLKGKTWAEITRDERFFCQHLYHLIRTSPRGFVAEINRITGLTLDAQTPWEIGYEVCFYRDFWHLMEKKVVLHSPKRTFDLCLFSKNDIVIIEAKAQQSFENDSSQEDSFKRDKILVAELTKANVTLIGLASSNYLTPQRKSKLLTEVKISAQPIFAGLLCWSDLSTYFSNDLVLARADEIYEKSQKGSLSGEQLLTVGDILKSIGAGKEFLIGCDGGLKKFAKLVHQVPSKKFRTSADTTPPNRNWFSSSEVIGCLGSFKNSQKTIKN